MVQDPSSNETTDYRKSENGLDLDYPITWYMYEQVLKSRASVAFFYSVETEEEPVFSAVVFSWEPNSLNAWLAV
jgi:hypothetical protein